MLDRLATKAYWEGEEAAGFGWATEASCPYPAGSKEQYDWLTGFRNAVQSVKDPS